MNILKSIKYYLKYVHVNANMIAFVLENDRYLDVKEFF